MITSFKLFESFFTSILEEKKWEDYKKYHIDSKSLDGIQMTDELGQSVFAADPTENKNYRQWLFNMYKTMNYEDFINFLSNAFDMLVIYDAGKNRIPKEYSDWKNIVNIKTPELFTEVVKFISDNKLNISKKLQTKMSKIAIESDFIKIFDNSEWAIVIPLTWEQSRYWAGWHGGKEGCNWCTAGDNSDNRRGGGHWHSYTSTGPLYIFYNYKNPELSHQLHFGSNGTFSFNNCPNSSVSFDNFLQKYSSQGFGDAILEFWNDFLESPNKYPESKILNIRECLQSFLSEFLKNPNSERSSLGGLILRVDSIMDGELSDKELNKIIIVGLQTYNMRIIKNFFDKNKDKINTPLSNGMTPLMNLASANYGGYSKEKQDEISLKIAEYLISLGADGSGTRENGSSNIVLECIFQDVRKHRTALLLSTLPNYNAENGLDFNKNEINSVTSFLLNLKIGNKTNSDTFSYEDYKTLLNNMIERGLKINDSNIGSRFVSPLLMTIFQYMNETNEGNKKNIYLLSKAFLECGASSCSGYTLRPGISPDMKAIDIINPDEFKEYHELFLEYSKKEGCV